MNPNDFLFSDFAEKINSNTAELFFYKNAKSMIDSIAESNIEYDQRIAVPRLCHVKTALQRELYSDGVTLPKGDAYISGVYDAFDVGEPKVRYASRIISQSDKKSESKITKTLDKFFDEDEPTTSTKLLFHTITPLETRHIKSIDTITFAVASISSGESYYFTLQANDNLDKVITSEVIGNEEGEVRERLGKVDKCPIKAVRASKEQTMLIVEELKRAEAELGLILKGDKVKSEKSSFFRALGSKAAETVRPYLPSRVDKI
jgi:hypothetical protein